MFFLFYVVLKVLNLLYIIIIIVYYIPLCLPGQVLTVVCVYFILCGVGCGVYE